MRRCLRVSILRRYAQKDNTHQIVISEMESSKRNILQFLHATRKQQDKELFWANLHHGDGSVETGKLCETSIACFVTDMC